MQKICVLDDHVLMAFAGLTADARILISKARVECQSHKLTVEDPVTLEYITRYVASQYLGFLWLMFSNCLTVLMSHYCRHQAEVHPVCWPSPVRRVRPPDRLRRRRHPAPLPDRPRRHLLRVEGQRHRQERKDRQRVPRKELQGQNHS